MSMDSYGENRPRLSDVCARSEAIWEDLLDFREELKIRVSRISCGAAVMDTGVCAEGSLEAGRLLTELSLGGLGRASVTMDRLDGIPVPSIVVSSPFPAAACLDLQMGVSVEGAILSGPIRLLINKPRYIEEDVPAERQDALRIALVAPYAASEETYDALAAAVSEKAGIRPEELRMVVAPRESIAGLTQICGRGIENLLLTIRGSLKKDPLRASEVIGKTPILPIPKADDERPRIDPDDLLHYLCEGYLAWNPEDGEDPEALCRDLTFETHPQYGVYFDDLLRQYDYDFFRIPNVSDINRIASLTVHDRKTGRICHAGTQRIDLIRARME